MSTTMPIVGPKGPYDFGGKAHRRLAIIRLRSGPDPPGQNQDLAGERVDPPDRQVVLSPEEETVEMACGEVAESFW